MKSRLHSFNIYFVLFCLVLTSGCAAIREIKKEANPKKEQSTIRLYMEGHSADRTTAGTVLVTREKIPYTVDRDPFLDEANLSKATIVDDPDGTFYIQLLFDDHGALLLDMYTASNKGKHIVVFSQFPTPGAKAKRTKKQQADADDADLVDTSNATPPPGTPRQSAWLTAVLIKDRISNGLFRFTPDASRAESLRIVRGLRNVLAKKGKSER